METEKIYVSIRVRPLNKQELLKGNPWKVDSRTIVLSNTEGKSVSGLTYTFDNVFGPEIKTEEIYRTHIQDIILNSIDGFNATVFAYGQTSSGKTFTMRGGAAESGIIPLAVQDVFVNSESGTDREYLIRVAYMEIYNEEINDLLAPESKKLQVHESPERGFFVAGLREEIVTNPERVLELMEIGERNRHFGETNMNQNSSRSHTIFRMVIESRDQLVDEQLSGPPLGSSDAVRVATLNLVDLAGSERITKTGSGGERMKEGTFINKSLHVLGKVINKLSEGSDRLGLHIPYRESSLTRILQPALGGNSKTAIICNVTPSAIHIEETKTTLQFASRAKKVTNCAQVNEVLTDAAVLKRQAHEIEDLKKKLQAVNSAEINKQIQLLRNQLLKAELEAERMALELEEQKAENERKIKEQQQKIRNLSSMVINSASDGHQEKRANRGSRRETWCPRMNGLPPQHPMEFRRPLVPLQANESLAEATPLNATPARRMHPSLLSAGCEKVHSDVADLYEDIFEDNRTKVSTSSSDNGDEEVSSGTLSQGCASNSRESGGRRQSIGGRISTDSVLSLHITDRRGRRASDRGEAATQQQLLDLQYKYEALKFQHEALVMRMEAGETKAEDDDGFVDAEEAVDCLFPEHGDEFFVNDDFNTLSRRCKSVDCADRQRIPDKSLKGLLEKVHILEAEKGALQKELMWMRSHLQSQCILDNTRNAASKEKEAPQQEMVAATFEKHAAHEEDVPLGSVKTDSLLMELDKASVSAIEAEQLRSELVEQRLIVEEKESFIDLHAQLSVVSSGSEKECDTTANNTVESIGYCLQCEQTRVMLSTELDAARKSLHACSQREMELEQKLEAAVLERDKLDDKFRMVDKELELSKARVEELVSQCRLQAEKNEGMNESLEISSKRIRELEDQQNVEMEKLRGADSENLTLRQEMEELRHSLSVTLEGKDDLEKQLTASEEARKLSTLENAALEEQIVRVKGQLEIANSQMESLRKAMEAMDEMRGSLAVCLERKDALEKQLNITEEAWHATVCDKAALEVELERVEGELERSRERALCLEESVATLTETRNGQMEKLRGADIEILKLSKEVEQWKGTLKVSSQEKDDLEKELKASEEAREVVMSEKAGLEEELKTMKGELETSSARMHCLEETLSSIAEKLREAKMENLQLSEAVEEVKVSLGINLQRKNDLEKELEALEEIRQVEMSEKADLEEELKTMKRELERSNARVQCLEESISFIEDVRNAQTEKLREAEMETSKLTKEMEETKVSLGVSLQRKSDLEEELKILEEARQAALSNKGALEEELDRTKGQLDRSIALAGRLGESVAMVEEARNLQIERLREAEAENLTLVKEMEGMKGSLSFSSQREADLEKMLKASEEARQIVVSDKADLQEELGRITEAFEVANTRAEGMEESVAGISELEKVQQLLQQTIEAQKEQLLSSEGEKMSMLAEKDKLHNELTQLQENLQVFHLRVGELEEECCLSGEKLRAEEQSRLPVSEDVVAVKISLQASMQREEDLAKRLADSEQGRLTAVAGMADLEGSAQDLARRLNACEQEKIYCQKELEILKKRLEDSEKERMLQAEKLRNVREEVERRIEEQARAAGEQEVHCQGILQRLEAMESEKVSKSPLDSLYLFCLG